MQVVSALENFPLNLILASTSPRRKELLSYLGLPFQIVAPNTEEKPRPGEDGIQYAKRNSMEKAEAVYRQHRDAHEGKVLAIGADTIGVIDDKILEKPLDAADAVRMLSEMSGRAHKVITAVSLVGVSAQGEHHDSFAVETLVHFKKLSLPEIQYYVQTKEPLDKAGAYGIQGIGGFIVRSIEGSYSNVVGLPLVELSEALQRWPRFG
ncbi:MAG: septum formation inhibitor Maf [Proteobacteria bacterium]|nr:MAG: septum formation inhibitor Maf [Pseudomonadota bacterium]